MALQKEIYANEHMGKEGLIEECDNVLRFYR